MPVSPGASGMQPRDPCRPWRGTLASGHVGALGRWEQQEAAVCICEEVGEQRVDLGKFKKTNVIYVMIFITGPHTYG